MRRDFSRGLGSRRPRQFGQIGPQEGSATGQSSRGLRVDFRLRGSDRIYVTQRPNDPTTQRSAVGRIGTSEAGARRGESQESANSSLDHGVGNVQEAVLRGRVALSRGGSKPDQDTDAENSQRKQGNWRPRNGCAPTPHEVSSVSSRDRPGSGWHPSTKVAEGETQGRRQSIRPARAAKAP